MPWSKPSKLDDINSKKHIDIGRQKRQKSAETTQDGERKYGIY